MVPLYCVLARLSIGIWYYLPHPVCLHIEQRRRYWVATSGNSSDSTLPAVTNRFADVIAEGGLARWSSTDQGARVPCA
jgi:hypothetical protein